MTFVDEARIFIKAGDGGKGCVSFYSDKLNRCPRPDGGDGGKGGDVIFIADSRMHTLLDFRFKQHYKAERGKHASSKGKKGRTGEDCLLRVPAGTLVWDYETGLLMKDLVSNGQRVRVAQGGRGGIGNANRKIPKPPKEGESKVIRLELKVLADVGLIGFPNVGKSTLISAISKVRSKIASYPFTTKQPVLGIVQDEDFSFTVADLPGLIEGAHQGKGLGDKFLKHTERTRLLIHVLDMAASEGRDPLSDYEKINYELNQYSDKLTVKHRLVVANKMDLPEAAEHLKRFKRKFREQIFPVSSLKKTGLDKVIKAIADILC